MDGLLPSPSPLLQGLDSQMGTPPAPAPWSPPPLAQPTGRRGFGDVTAIRQSIFDNVLNSAMKFQPVESKTHRLELVDPAYEGPERYSKKDQKNAILTGKTLSRKLKGTWRLVDLATQQPISERRATIANVPYFGDRGAFILSGNRYSLGHQLRLMSGAFSRQKESGELESHINVLPGQGLAHRVMMDPESGIFKLKIAQGEIPMWPVLRAMGVTPSQLNEAWGPELAAANMAKNDRGAVDKLYRRLVRGNEPDEGLRGQAVAEAFRKMKLDPEVNKETLREAFDKVDAPTWLAATRKLLAINKGEDETDDRDNPAFQTLLGPEDLLAERFGRDKNMLRRMLWKGTIRKNLDHIPSGILTSGLLSAITDSGLGNPGEEINPGMLIEQMYRVSRLGEGGIPSVDSVPDEARSVQPGQFGFIDSLVTPESLKAGVDSRFAYAAEKGKDGRMYAPFRDARTGQTVFKSPQEITKAVLAFPNAMATYKDQVPALVGGKMKFVPRDKVDFEVPNMESTLSPMVTMVPMKSAMKGQRAAMAQRMLTQALSLDDGEAPFVRTGVPEDVDDSFENRYGEMFGASRSKVDGTVTHVDNDEITIQTPDGKKEVVELWNHDPSNRKTYLHNTAVVKPGDRVGQGQLLAHSNYTDKNGVVALGRNARTAYIAWKGINFEDAFAISESFAKRLSSQHMYQHGLDLDDNIRTKKRDFISMFPSKYPRKVLDSIDDDGVVKPGTILQPDDPIILGAKQKERAKNSLHKARDRSFSDQTETWDHHSPGEVVDVAKTDKGIVVTVKSVMQAQTGDKISGRYGDKGVIAKIIPDSQMPVGADGKPYEVLANPLGIITRTNPAQVVEATLGKIAAMTGKHYNVKDFKDIPDLVQYAMQELQKNGLSDTEDLIDPSSNNRKIPGIFTGNRYFMKLHHTAESKGQGRSMGGYTSEGLPAKGGQTGSKRVSLLDANALLSHGATEFLRDAAVVRGQQHPEYWTQYMSGHAPPMPKVPMVYKKFVDTLRGSGINVVRNGTRFNTLALRDADIDEFAGNREITNSDTVDWKGGLNPVKGGLFDPELTGGHGGNRWSFIKLSEPMPSPVMEEPIRRVLGLTENKFLDILAGREKLNDRTGPSAIKYALDSINLPRMIENARADIASGKKTRRDEAIRKLKYLKSAEQHGIHPRDWMLTKVPVIPPVFRPVSVMQGSKLPMVADANALYKEIMDSNGILKDAAGKFDDLGDERLAVYNSFKALTGLADPTQPKNQERKVKGLLKTIFGGSPKYGFVQQKLIGSVVDTVGRGTIIPDPDLDMDEVGIPEDKAWEVYKPHIVRGLVRNGMSRMDAARAVTSRSDRARTMLLRTMEDRPVVLNRAPTLHRYNLMAFRPKLIQDDTIHISPTIVTGFNADFDGDAMQYHVPQSDEAVADAYEKMLPSRNLLAVSNFRAHQLPGKEYAGGLYRASKPSPTSNRTRTFATVRDAVQAYRRGEIGVDDNVEIINPR